jgi:hypothetical protein
LNIQNFKCQKHMVSFGYRWKSRKMFNFFSDIEMAWLWVKYSRIFVISRAYKYIIFRFFLIFLLTTSTFKDYENSTPCVVKTKIAKSRVAENKRLRNILQSHKNCVEASSPLVAKKNIITHSTVLRILKKKTSHLQKTSYIASTQLEKIPLCYRERNETLDTNNVLFQKTCRT